MKVSVCMIVWNEEEHLRAAVESVTGLADEVVVVDTGSTDGTVELARSLGCRVIEGIDRMHKGNARNRAIDEAAGDWVVILDADERATDPVALRALLERTDALGVFVRFVSLDAAGNPGMGNKQLRCWRRGSFRYKYRAHEVPLSTGPEWGKIVEADSAWEHRPPPGRGWKARYALDRLLLDVEENPEALRPLFYLGRQYMYCKEYRKAITTLEQYLEFDKGGERANAWRYVAVCRGALGNRDGKVLALFTGCSEDPSRRECWGELAELYHAEGRDIVAVGLLRCALEMPRPSSGYFFFRWYGAHVHDLLARCFWKLGRYEEGREQAALAVELAPNNARLADNLVHFERKVGCSARGSAFYDAAWANIVHQDGRMEHIRELTEIAARYTIGSVLDLGCGTGELAEFIDGREYVGVDFSEFAIDYARSKHPSKHPGRRFICGDVRDLAGNLPKFDSIVMLEVLEHLDDPVSACRSALNAAKQRVIVSVPVDMPATGHVKSRWTHHDIEEMLGELSSCEKVMDGTYWLAVREI